MEANESKVYYPNGEEIDIMKCRNVQIIYPDRNIHNVIPLFVQETVDGRFVLNYLEFAGKMLVRQYTEINYIEDEWSKKPISLDYSKFVFKDFNREISDSIIKQLPEQMIFRIYIRPDQIAIKKADGGSVVEATNVGAKVVKAQDEKDVFMVLPSNSGEDGIEKQSFDFEFAFPAFGYLGNTDHDINENDSRFDINYDCKYSEQMFLREELPMSVRRTVASFLKEGDSDTISIKELPILSVHEDDKLTNICFISCSDIPLYSDIYRADKVFIDNDMEPTGTYDNIFESALHGEIPMTIGLLNGGVLINGVRHNKEKNNKLGM